MSALCIIFTLRGLLLCLPIMRASTFMNQRIHSFLTTINSRSRGEIKVKINLLHKTISARCVWASSIGFRYLLFVLILCKRTHIACSNNFGNSKHRQATSTRTTIFLKSTSRVPLILYLSFTVILLYYFSIIVVSIYVLSLAQYTHFSIIFFVC